MSDPERSPEHDEQRNFEQRVVEGHISREEFKRIKNEPLVDGLTVGKFVEYGITDQRFIWGKDRLIPDYKNAGSSLGEDIQVALVRESNVSGEMPDVILTRIINNGLGIIDKNSI